jgi:hypothetical protein
MSRLHHGLDFFIRGALRLELLDNLTILGCSPEQVQLLIGRMALEKGMEVLNIAVRDISRLGSVFGEQLRSELAG